MPSRHVSRKAFTCSGSRSDVINLVSNLFVVVDHLKIRVKTNAVGRIEIDALQLASQALALGEASHHLQGVTEDHAVRPVLVVLVELDHIPPHGIRSYGEQACVVCRFSCSRAPASPLLTVRQLALSAALFPWM